MKEIYTMIMNSSVTTIIVIIFLWQYINEHKKDNAKKSEDKVNTANKNDNNFFVLLINKLDDILQKVDEIVFILKNKE